MRLSWRDGIATVLTAAAVALYIGYRTDADLLLVSSTRLAAISVLVLGWAACAVGGAGRAGAADWTRAGTLLLSGVGVVTLLAALTALVTGNEAALAVLVGALVVLWFAATLRHLVAGGHRGPMSHTP
jgi:hypothetical protein